MEEDVFNLINLMDGASYEPSEAKDVQVMIKLLEIKPGQKAVDLGSGDGRIVIAMAQKGALAFGFEKNKDLVEEARKNIKKFGLGQTAFIHHGNFWEQNLSVFDKIAVFQFHTIMDRLEEKLLRELNPGTFVVSNHWTFPHWIPQKQEEDIYLYIK